MISYRNSKQFDRNNFEKEIKNTLITQKVSPKDFLAFKYIVLEALNLHAPSKLRNEFLKLQTLEARLRYNKQRNLCVMLQRKAEKKYDTDLKISDINDNKKFWKDISLFWVTKNKGNKTIALEERNKVMKRSLMKENLLKPLMNIL